MSRSYRKHVWCVDNYGKYWGKRYAARRLRRFRPVDFIVGKSMLYKRFYPQYDISDYKYLCKTSDFYYDKYRRK